MCVGLGVCVCVCLFVLQCACTYYDALFSLSCNVFTLGFKSVSEVCLKVGVHVVAYQGLFQNTYCSSTVPKRMSSKYIQSVGDSHGPKRVAMAAGSSTFFLPRF